MAHKGTVSHAEMWDDSALVDSWNDALEEYKARLEPSAMDIWTYIRLEISQYQGSWRRRRQDLGRDPKVKQFKVSLTL